MRLASALRPVAGRLAFAVLAGTATIAANVGLMGTSSWLIARAALHPPLYTLMLAITGVRFFGLSRAVLRYTERLATHDATLRAVGHLRSWFFGAVASLPPHALAEERSGDLLGRAVADVDTLQTATARGAVPPVVALLTGAGTAAFLSRLLPAWGPLFLAGFALAGLGIPALSLALSHRIDHGLAERRGMLRARLVDGAQGRTDLRLASRLADQEAAVAEDSHAVLRAQGRLARVDAATEALVQAAAWGLAVALLVAAAPAVRDGRLAGYLLPVGLFVVLAAFEAIAPLPGAASLLTQARDALGRLGRLAPAAPQAGGTAAPGGHDLSVRGLLYAYPDGTPVLRGLDLSVGEGEHVVVRGPSGTGKTTLARLLLRQMDPPASTVLVGGVDVRDWDEAALRRRFAVVSQDAYLFDTTLRENLRLGRADATDAEMETALRTARLGDLLDRLPGGLDTPVGEHGARLSGGEVRRVAVARALLRDAPIVLLDEPTEGLDAQTERELEAALEPLVRDRTVLLITHKDVRIGRVDGVVTLG